MNIFNTNNMRRVSDVSDKAGYDAFVERMNQKYGKSWTIWTLTKDEKREFRTYIGNNFDSVKQQKYNGMKRIRDYADYIKCPNSNLLFYGTKLDGNGNDCAVFGTPNGRKFLIQRNSLWGTESWNTGSKSTMDAETFLSKNPNVTLERLEKDVIRAANELNASWGKNIRVYNKSIFDSKNSEDMKRVRDNNNGRKCLYFVDEDANAELTRRLLNGISHSLKDDPTIVDWVVGEMKKNHCEDFVGDWDDEPTTSMMSKDSEDGRYTMYWNDYGEIEIWGNENISDSRKIKDENTPDVLDGVLFIAFTDGTEDDMIAEVNKHANESDTIDGVQYETYETDNSDGVAMIDLCAATGDANAFVKALLKKWGIAENVADLEFEASDEMKEAVNDSRKVGDDAPRRFTPVTPKTSMYERGVGYEHPSDIARRNYEMRQYLKEQGVPEWEIDDILKETVKDSRVNDMTKPAHLRGYAEKMRAKRRNKNVEPTDEPENENQKQDVTDSRRVRDERQTFKGQYIGDSPFAKQYESFVDELLKSGKMKRGDLSQADIHDKFEEEMLETSESGDDFEVWAYNDDPRFGDYGEADAGIFVEYDKDGYVTDIYTVG